MKIIDIIYFLSLKKKVCLIKFPLLILCIHGLNFYIIIKLLHTKIKNEQNCSLLFFCIYFFVCLSQ